MINALSIPGVCGDGIHNDYPALQAALNANAHIYFPSAIYNLNGQNLQFGNNYQRLTGDGANASVILGGIKSNGLATTYYPSIADLQFLGAGTGIGCHLKDTQFANLQNVVIKNFATNIRGELSFYLSMGGILNISGATDHNMDMDNCNAMTITGGCFNQGANGIRITNSNGFTLLNPNCESNAGKGLNIADCVDATIITPRMEGNGIGLYWRNSATVEFHNAHLSGNTVQLDGDSLLD